MAILSMITHGISHLRWVQWWYLSPIPGRGYNVPPVVSLCRFFIYISKTVKLLDFIYKIVLYDVKMIILWFFENVWYTGNIPNEGWPKILTNFLMKDEILGFPSYMQFMGYIQYKICIRYPRPISSAIQKI